MSRLSVRFEGGFANDVATVHVGGRQLLEQHGLTTDYAAGLAGSAEMEVADGRTEVEVRVPARGLAIRLDFSAAGTVYLRVWISEGQLHAAVAPEAPQYL